MSDSPRRIDPPSECGCIELAELLEARRRGGEAGGD